MALTLQPLLSMPFNLCLGLEAELKWGGCMLPSQCLAETQLQALILIMVGTRPQSLTISTLIKSTLLPPLPPCHKTVAGRKYAPSHQRGGFN